MSDLKYNEFTISVPGDAEDSIEALAALAILQADDEAETYHLPCTWEADWESGEVGDNEVTFKVRQYYGSKE